MSEPLKWCMTISDEGIPKRGIRQVLEIRRRHIEVASILY